MFFIVYMILLIVVSDWLLLMWDKLKGVRGRAYLAVIVIAAGTVSGALTIGREYYSGGMYETFSKDKVEMAEYIKKNTPPDAVFLTGVYHLNPVASLAGRSIYVGSSLYVYFHGMGDEYKTRKAAMERAFGGTYEELVRFCHKNGISYVYTGANESDMKVNNEALSKLTKVYSAGAEALYKVD